MSQFAPAKKSLGQNFLQSSTVIQRIIDALHVQASDCVLEIGPGRGALTTQLLETQNPLALVEYDRELAEFWRSQQSKHPQLTVHEGDILQCDLADILSSSNTIKVVGNLPYNISSPILFHLMSQAQRIETQVCMLQKEVVQRMVATPGNKQYGRLSVMLQQRYRLEYLFTVPANAFKPAPKVESAVVKMIPYTSLPHPVNNTSHFAALVKQAFSQRRKTLKNNLKGLITESEFNAADIDPKRRAETLSVVEFVALSNLTTA